MNKKDRGILIGMSIGDGNIKYIKDNRYPNSFISNINIIHGQKQKEYIEYKANLLHSIFGGNKPKVVEINNNGYIGYRVVKSNKYFRLIYKNLYNHGIKEITRKVLDKLTPQGIAIWYMDDGSLYPKKRNGKIHAYELVISTYVSQEENQTIIDYFKDIYDINFTQVKGKGKYRIRCGTKEARKFVEIVKPYIIKSMEYKIKF